MDSQAVDAALRSWIETAGGYVHPDLCLLSPTDDGEHGAVAKRCIPKGDKLLSCPLNLCIYRPCGDDPKPHRNLSAAVEYLRVHAKERADVQTVLLLMAQIAQRGKSFFAPYIASLPERPRYMMEGWSDEELAELKGTSIWRRRDLAPLWQATLQPLLAARPDLWPPATATLPAFERALGCLHSRCFHMHQRNFVTGEARDGETVYLIPGVDMLNHATRPEQRCTTLEFTAGPAPAARSGDEAADKESGGRHFSLVAERSIAAGEQCFQSYGELSDSQLLSIYGFVEDWPEGSSNPHNYVWLPATLLQQAARACIEDGEGPEAVAGGWPPPERCELLRQLRCLPEHYVLTMQRPLPDDLVTAAQVMCMDGDEFETYRSHCEAELAAEGAMRGMHSQPVGMLGASSLEEDPVSGHAVCTVLLRSADSALQAYPTTLKQDEALLANPQGLGERKKAAVQVRLGEKRVLLAAKRQIIRMLMAMEAGGSEEDTSSEEDGEEEGGEEEGEESDSSGEAAARGSGKRNRAGPLRSSAGKSDKQPESKKKKKKK